MTHISKTIPRLMNPLVVAKEGANPIKVKNPTLYKIGRFFKGLLAKLQGKQNDMPTLEDKEFQKTELAHKVVVETLKNLPTKISEAKPEVTLYEEEKFKIICRTAGIFNNTLEISAIDANNNEHFKFILPNDNALEKYTNGLENFDKYNDLERLTITTER